MFPCHLFPHKIMMVWRCLRFFVSLALFSGHSADVCNRYIRTCTVTKIQYYCCSNYVLKKGTCEECPVGFTTHPEEAVCKPCSSNFFGYRCIEDCSCKEKESCNYIYGCVRDETDQHHTTEPTAPTTVFSVFPNRESIIYIGSIGLMAFIICSLMAYICYKKNRKKKSFDKNRSNENPRVHWDNEHKNTDENEYAEIEETFLYNIKTATREVKVKDKEVNYDRNHVNNDDFMNGYLNPFQPIKSTEGDVHQYSSTMIDGDNATTSADNQSDSGYLNQHQSLTLDTLEENKHAYNELKSRITKKDTEIQKFITKDGEDESDSKMNAY